MTPILTRRAGSILLTGTPSGILEAITDDAGNVRHLLDGHPVSAEEAARLDAEARETAIVVPFVDGDFTFTEPEPSLWAEGERERMAAFLRIPGNIEAISEAFGADEYAVINGDASDPGSAVVAFSFSADVPRWEALTEDWTRQIRETAWPQRIGMGAAPATSNPFVGEAHALYNLTLTYTRPRNPPIAELRRWARTVSLTPWRSRSVASWRWLWRRATAMVVQVPNVAVDVKAGSGDALTIEGTSAPRDYHIVIGGRHA
jgi:hypothetical protein